MTQALGMMEFSFPEMGKTVSEAGLWWQGLIRDVLIKDVLDIFGLEFMKFERYTLTS